ncbi:hypothetical protein NECAME_06703 [Necator americanus]|uniref:Uncharacterized protein n=1 Tax=Necator americanus TaxID=51031 RepID=W2TSV1_NECAM|nr:hypothetical protein NECAME_06703 [Necator americanus]ETN84739.1 hypothetical protein NECAME_06703 [Necator americanus]
MLRYSGETKCCTHPPHPPGETVAAATPVRAHWRSKMPLVRDDDNPHSNEDIHYLQRWLIRSD